jgi:hypothetical protein
MKNINIIDPFIKKQIFDLTVDQLSILNAMDSSVKKELKKKYNAYKNQDKIKHKFDDAKHITFSEMIEKLHISQLKCYYCNCDVLILFNKKREGNQWTLERLDNNLGHYASNTCIACLKCNLKRRTDSHEYFKQGKQLQLIKLE